MELKYINTLSKIFNLSKTLDYYSQKVALEKNLTKVEAIYLRILWQNPGVTQLELSRLNDTSKPIAVSYITRLEKKGMIKKIEDNNKKRIYCTEIGKETVEDLLKMLDKAVSFLFEEYTDEEIKKYFTMTNRLKEKVIELKNE